MVVVIAGVVWLLVMMVDDGDGGLQWCWWC